jgi:hypothetical protein
MQLLRKINVSSTHYEANSNHFVHYNRHHTWTVINTVFYAIWPTLHHTWTIISIVFYAIWPTLHHTWTIINIVFGAMWPTS